MKTDPIRFDALVRDAKKFGLVTRDLRNEREANQWLCDWLDTVPACSGPCGQDSRRCTTPEACQMPTRDKPREVAIGLLWVIAAAAVVVAVLQVTQ